MYILASKSKVFYVGVTNDLFRRVFEHKRKLVKGFTAKYNVNRLVYYECTDDVTAAIYREKQLKRWRRQWKIELIEKENSEWKDLYEELEKEYGEIPDQVRDDILNQARSNSG